MKYQKENNSYYNYILSINNIIYLENQTTIAQFDSPIWIVCTTARCETYTDGECDYHVVRPWWAKGIEKASSTVLYVHSIYILKYANICIEERSIYTFTYNSHGNWNEMGWGWSEVKLFEFAQKSEMGSK